MGVVLAPWEEQPSSLSQRTGGVTKIRCKVELLASRTAQLIVLLCRGALGASGSIGRNVELGRVVQPLRPTDPHLGILNRGSSIMDPQLNPSIEDPLLRILSDLVLML